MLSSEQSQKTKPYVIANALDILTTIGFPIDQRSDLRNYICDKETDLQQAPLSIKVHQRQAQQAWLALLRSHLTKGQRKAVLSRMTRCVVPWFRQSELLMDFLTDSLNIGGAVSLLSLSGLFHLMRQRNLDYPDFYIKLYSLLDSDLLYSKYRSRFFRLLAVFLSSTHLPVALVASFVKRLSRLALTGPPAGIVVAIPWIYNMLKSHPTCTFMIHRETICDEGRQLLDLEGAHDPFDMCETDPMKTEALQTCLWELVMLQSHYHPNVASLARIIREQFTKQGYNLEDFLDHSYNNVRTQVPRTKHFLTEYNAGDRGGTFQGA